MRCDDLIRGLAKPTDALASARIAEHLAACPACAERSRLSGQLDRIWEATRPSEPSSDALDALWARASAELDRLETPATIKFQASRPDRRRRAMVGFFVAQAAAAALLMVVLAPPRHGPVKSIDIASIKPVAKEPVFIVLNVDPDEDAVVRLDKGNQPLVEKHARPTNNASAAILQDTAHDEVNAIETMDSTWFVATNNR